MKTDGLFSHCSHSIVVRFTVEAGQDRDGSTGGAVTRPLSGILTNYGYCIPDPDFPDRLSVWFSGGSIEVADPERDGEDWNRLFDPSMAPRRDLTELARVLAARVLLGANLGTSEDGRFQYSLRRPIGGHGSVYVDVVYSDDTMKIIRGHQGTTFVFVRSLG